MIKLKQAVIVEGKYDKIKLQSVIDAPILTTNGFSIFKDKEKMKFIRRLADKRGIIILTDSDSAGFVIRNHILSCVPKDKITNVYIPDIFGKEKRKKAYSAEGKLGVEGVSVQIIEDALKKAGIIGDNTKQTSIKPIIKADLVEFGLSGGTNSALRRSKLLNELDLPQHLTPNGMLDALNIFLTYNEFKILCEKLFLED